MLQGVLNRSDAELERNAFDCDQHSGAEDEGNSKALKMSDIDSMLSLYSNGHSNADGSFIGDAASGCSGTWEKCA